MAIDLARETLKTLAEIAVMMPGRGGKRVNPSTVFRWCKTGIRTKAGALVYLDHVQLGGRIISSVEAVDRFGKALTGEPTPTIEKRTPNARERASEKAGAKLEALGI